MNKPVLAFLGFFLTGLSACGLWVQSPKKPGGTGSTPQAQTPEALATTPVAAVYLVEAATKSVGVGIQSMRAPSAPLALLADGEKIEGCSAANEPILADAEKNIAKDRSGDAVLPSSDAEYALGKFYCTIAANSGDEGSVLGAFDTPKLVTCLAGNDITYDGTEYTSEVTVAGNACFAVGTPEGLPPIIGVKVTARKPAGPYK